jgi:hypothetical protein
MYGGASESGDPHSDEYEDGGDVDGDVRVSMAM